MKNNANTNDKFLKEIEQLKSKIAVLEKSEISKAKETVIKSEQKYRPLVDGTFDIIMSIDLKGNVNSWNRRAEEVFGYTANEIIGENVFILMPKELINEQQEILAKVKELGFAEGIESLRVAKDGSQIPVEMTISTMNDSSGNLIGISAILRDITERKEAEKALEERERYFRSILYSIHEDIIVIDSEYLITDINNTALTTTGFKRKEIIGKHCYEVSHNYNLPCHQMGEDCAMEKVFETGEGTNRIHKHQRADGSNVYVDILFSPMKDAEGKVTHVIEAVRDITDIIHAQDELQESLEREQSLADIVRNAPMGIAYGYPDGRLENCNAAFSELTGYSLKELQDINWSETLTPIKWKESETKELAKLSSKNRVVQYEKEYIRKDGKIIPIELVVSAKFDDEGNMLHDIGFVTDITKRKEADELLRESEEKFRLLTENSIDCIWTTDKSLRLTYLSPTLERIIGCKPEEWIGTKIGSHFKKKEFVRVGALAATAIKNYKEFKPITIETKMLNNKNEEVDLEISGKVLLNREGKLIGIQGIGRDITERKQAAEELRKSELLLKNTFAALEEAVFVVTLDRVLISSNKSAEKMLGYKHEEFVKHSTEIFHLDHDHYVEFGRRTKEAFDEGRSANFEFKLKRKNGEIFPTEHTVSMLKDEDGKAFGIVSVIRDITERKQAEKELKKHQEHLEETVQERTKELQDKNKELDRAMKVFVGRELKIRDLEKRIRVQEGKE